MADNFDLNNNTTYNDSIKPPSKYEIGDIVHCVWVKSDTETLYVTGKISDRYYLNPSFTNSIGLWDYQITVLVPVDYLNDPNPITVRIWNVENYIIRLATNSEMAFYVLSVGTVNE